jgi:hypothetical protein
MKRTRLFFIACVILISLCGCSELPSSPTERAQPSASSDTQPAATPSRGGGVLPITATVLRPELVPYATNLRQPFVNEMEAYADATRYDIELTIQADVQHVSGVQRTRYVNRRPEELREILLRLYPNTAYMGGGMQVGAVQVDGVPVQPAVYLRDTADLTRTRNAPLADTSVLSVPLATPLRMGQSVVLSFTFTVTIPPRSNSGYRTFGWASNILGLPNAYGVIPVRDGRGWRVDTAPTYGDIVFGETSQYRVLIHAPADLVIAATGVCTDTVAPAPKAQPAPKPGAQGATWKDTRCVAGLARDFAIHASRQYQVVSQTVGTRDGNVLVSSYYMPVNKRGGKLALDYGIAAMQDYERRLGPYPYKELKLFASPTTAGGIEYPMLAGILDSLYNQEGGYFEWIVAHEVAHQWWYAMVGSDPINEAWLDESLTQYTTSLYIEERYGSDAAEAERQHYFTERYQREVGDRRDAPVAQPTGAFARDVYAPLIYGKGPLFYSAVRRAVGDRLFSAWLRVYFMRYRFKIARAEDLLAVADEIGIGRETRLAFAEWMRGTRQSR